MSEGRIVEPAERILITGASGFIGARVVNALLESGFSNLRCFVRHSSSLRRLDQVLDSHGGGRQVEVFRGDLLSRENCARAAHGASVVYHLAAGMDKSFAAAFMNSVLTTRNLIEALLEGGPPKRFVNVSSFAVYSTLNARAGSAIDESSPLEDAPQDRGDAYAFAKLKQEQLVREYGRAGRLRYVILRPGTVFGPGRKSLSGRVGVGTFGVFIQVGGGNLLPLTYVDNCAEAIVLAGLVPGLDGETFNVVDDQVMTSAEFLRAYKRRVPGFRSIRLPYSAAYFLSTLWERYAVRSKGQIPAVFNRRRCTAEWQRHTFSNRKLRERVGWRPRVGLKEGMTAFLDQFGGRRTA